MSPQLFHRREAAAPLLLAFCTGAGLMALGANAKAADFSGSAALTTDYVWRGTRRPKAIRPCRPA